MKNYKHCLFVLPFLLLTGCSNEATVSKKQYDNMYDHLVDMWADSLKGAGYKVAFYGDSRVAGGNFKEEFEEYKAVNLGVGGDRVNDLINRFTLIEACQPEITFIAIGGNDALSGNYNIESTATSFEQLISKFENASTKVVVHTNPGINSKTSSYVKDIESKNKGIKELNDVIVDTARKHNIDVIDLAALLNDSNNALKEEYSTDGVHFSKEGYDIWYNAIHSYLDLNYTD